jgi:beta-mannosidase
MSEYGVQSFPSYNSLINVYSFPEDADFFSELNLHRQHHENGNEIMIEQIKHNLPLPTNLTDKVDYFKALIYLTQINQAMTYKTATELFRRNRNNCMGSMYWQLNDLWQVCYQTISFF